MGDLCESAGGWVYGKVFNDQNNNGIYDGHLGETGFISSTPVQLELLGCETTSAACDTHDYFNPQNHFRRTFDITEPGVETGNFALCPDAENGGCFRFHCPDCYGDFKVALSRTIEPQNEGWYNSGFIWGEYRRGWSFSDDPHVTCDVRNNFDLFESACFNLREDVKVVLDFGMNFGEVARADRHEPSVTDDLSRFTAIASQNEQNQEEILFASSSSSISQIPSTRRKRLRRKKKQKK